jgi:4-amino-4-deoxy-L-arabinose transferase-like glycosyltransferase
MSTSESPPTQRATAENAEVCEQDGIVKPVADRFAPGFVGRLFRSRTLAATMTALQLVWLGVMWITGVASNAWKIPYLLGYTLVAGATIQLLPGSFWSWLRSLGASFVQNQERVVVGLVLVVAVAGGAYAGYQEVLTDEGFLMRASMIVAEKGVGSFFAGYADIGWLGGQHPPLVPLVYGFAMRILGPDLLLMRLIATGVTAGAVMLTYRLGRVWFDPRTGLVAALLLVAMPCCLRMGTAVLTDMPVTFFFLLGLSLVHRLPQSRSVLLAASAGLAIGLGLVSKYTMLLIYPVLSCHFVTEGRLRRVWPFVALTVLASATVLGTWLAYAYTQGILASQAVTLSEYARVVTGGAWVYMVEMISTELTSAVGFYNLPLLCLGVYCLLRERRKSDLLVLLWIVPVFAVVTFTVPDPRYFMPAFPALALAMARGLRLFAQERERIVLLALLLCAGSLCIFADWYRAAFLFVP